MKYIIAIIAFLLWAFALFYTAEPAEVTSYEDKKHPKIIVNVGSTGETIDSASLELFYPADTTNRVDSVGLISPTGDSTWLISEDTLATDSIGLHLYRLWFWGSNIDSVKWGYWNHTYSGEPWAGNSVQNDTLEILSSADSTAIIGADITVRPDGGGIAEAQGQSNASGIFPYGGIDGAHDVGVYKQGYSFDAITDITLSGSQTDTIFGTPISLASAVIGQTTIKAWQLTPAGDTINPTYLKYRPVKSDSSFYVRSDRLSVGTGGSTIVLSKEWIILTSDSSLFVFDIYPNSSIYVNGVLDTSSIFEFWISFEDTETQIWIEVLDTTEQNPFEN